MPIAKKRTTWKKAKDAFTGAVKVNKVWMYAPINVSSDRKGLGLLTHGWVRPPCLVEGKGKGAKASLRDFYKFDWHSRLGNALDSYESSKKSQYLTKKRKAEKILREYQHHAGYIRKYARDFKKEKNNSGLFDYDHACNGLESAAEKLLGEINSFMKMMTIAP